MKYTAIYARQSIDKADSISTDTQTEYCERELKEGDKKKVYIDKGYSGKNTDRPEFKRMMNDIESGSISKVVVYKLDRISRSLTDFARMWDVFENNGVDFVSATEHFDTTSPIGKAMLYICMIFAQMEREQIQQRVTHAFLDRSKHGFYMGGKVPFGYRLVPYTIDGIHTKRFEIIPEEAEALRLIYKLYSNPSMSLKDVIMELKKQGISSDRNKLYVACNLSSMMKNPVYTYADSNMYRFFKNQKADIVNPPEQFIGETGLYLYQGEHNTRSKSTDDGRYLVIAPHTPIIDSETWLACRHKLLSHKATRITDAINSILVGSIFCGECGHSITVKPNIYKKRYCYCKNRIANGACNVKLPTIRADELERVISDRICDKLKELDIHAKQDRESEIQKRINELQLQDEKLDGQIQTLIDNLICGGAAKKYIQDRINELDTEREKIKYEIAELEYSFEHKKVDTAKLLDIVQKWDSLTFDEQRSIVKLLIDKIFIYPDKLEIMWKIDC